MSEFIFHLFCGFVILVIAWIIWFVFFGDIK